MESKKPTMSNVPRALKDDLFIVQDEELLHYLPSEVASSVLLCARIHCGFPKWSGTLTDVTGGHTPSVVEVEAISTRLLKAFRGEIVNNLVRDGVFQELHSQY